MTTLLKIASKNSFCEFLSRVSLILVLVSAVTTFGLYASHYGFRRGLESADEWRPKIETSNRIEFSGESAPGGIYWTLTKTYGEVLFWLVVILGVKFTLQFMISSQYPSRIFMEVISIGLYITPFLIIYRLLHEKSFEQHELLWSLPLASLAIDALNFDRALISLIALAFALDVSVMIAQKLKRQDLTGN